MYISVNHNLMAANTARKLTSHYRRLATSAQRLSSGLRINSAADDTAGLAIRELQRADMATLKQGIQNAEDAISLIQVADGALGIIDEKLIRMKELAEQAATGTYDSTQRLIIDSEFQAMASEIDRIARATDFNGIHLLNGSLSGEYDGYGLNVKGKMKIHFGSGNDEEDYYYVNVPDCTLAGLGLRDSRSISIGGNTIDEDLGEIHSLKEFLDDPAQLNLNNDVSSYSILIADGAKLADFNIAPGAWYSLEQSGYTDDFPILKSVMIIPKGYKNVLINAWGCDEGGAGDNDLQLFTKDGVHLAGTPLTDYAWNYGGYWDDASLSPAIENNEDRLGFTIDQYDDSYLNNGPFHYDETGLNLEFTNYKGTVIGFSGDRDQHDSSPQNGIADEGGDYEVLFISEAKEDLVLYYPGAAKGFVKIFWNLAPAEKPPTIANTPSHFESKETNNVIDIKTQDNAQKALIRIDDAIINKDKIRAHLGALQNRLENTVSNLTIQAENLQESESRISDVDVVTEMTNFVRNQILAQSAVAMMAQANSMPQMAMKLIGK